MNKIEATTPRTGRSLLPLVRLVQCSRRTCSHVLIESEREWVPSDIGNKAVCPLCGNDSFYHLKPNGQAMKFSEREKYRDGINPEEITPSPRHGPKMTKALIRAKWHAINQANDGTQRPGDAEATNATRATSPGSLK